jgi:hypothetical protein
MQRVSDLFFPDENVRKFANDIGALAIIVTLGVM